MGEESPEAWEKVARLNPGNVSNQRAAWKEPPCEHTQYAAPLHWIVTMPMDRTKYPNNWDEIANTVKDQAGWKCEQCGLQCRFPGEQFDTHKRTLTVAHINHVEMDCRPENLVALCPRCHLAYDQTRKVMQRLAKKRIKSVAESTLF